MDYILFIRQAVDLNPNPEEVQATQYVTLQQLRNMMLSKSGLRWSPWFRIIADNFLPDWWTNLDAVISTDTFVDVKTIHRILS
jgi:isopentenyl-diphosphate delta-isomerase